MILKKEKRNLIYGLIFAAPAILGFLMFSIGPMIASLILSLTDYSLTNETHFIGLENFARLFSGKDPFFYKSIMVTIYFVFLNVPAGIIFSFMVALLLNNEIKGRSIFRTIFYIPTIVPIVATSMIWMWLFSPDFGLINSILKMFNLPTSKWLFSERMVIPSLVIMAVWYSGSMMVVFLAGLQGIPRQLYEAVEVDGGNAFRKFIHVTVPMMTPTIFFNAVMHMIASFQAFSQAYIITQGGPNNASLFYVYYLYREAFEFQKIGSSAAVSWVLFAIIATLTTIAFTTSKRWVFYGGDGQ